MNVRAGDGAWLTLWTGDPMTLPMFDEIHASMNGAPDPLCRTFVATGLTPGQVYFFRIKACNALGWSDDGHISDGMCTNGTVVVLLEIALYLYIYI
jgi:hypothetical protein